MVRVPLMTPIGYGGGSSCSLSSRSQAAQCNIHQAFIIALLAMFHGVRAIRLSPIDGSRMYGRAGILAHPYMLGANGQSNGCVSLSDYPEFLNAFLRGEVTRLVVVERLESPSGKFAAGQLLDRSRDELKADRSFQYAAASY